MFQKFQPHFEKNSKVEHPEKQCVTTRVSEYLIKYGTGKIDSMPTDTRPEVNDPRSVDQMLDDDFCESLGTDELDVMMRLDEYRERYANAVADIQATDKQKSQFDAAVKVINDPNSSSDARYHAFEILDELERKGKVTRART